MQFIESSVIGVRAARLVFASPTSPVLVTLFPMVHVGEAAFYAETYADALAHDVVLFEGVRSPIVDRVTRAYRWIIGGRSLPGIVLQPRLPDAVGATRIVHADLSRSEFEVEWRKVPLWVRAVIHVLAPAVGLWGRWRLSRERLAKHMQCDDQPGLLEQMGMTPETGALYHAILDARDERLIERLRQQLDAAAQKPTRLAIVYGARHMRAVVRELNSVRDFLIRDSSWRMLIALD